MPPDTLDWVCFACNHCAPPQSNYNMLANPKMAHPILNSWNWPKNNYLFWIDFLQIWYTNKAQCNTFTPNIKGTCSATNLM